LEKIFDTLIDSFIENKVGIAAHFLSVPLANRLRAHLLQLYEQDLLKTGRTGNEAAPLPNTAMRSDVIYWLDSKHGSACEDEFLGLMDRFVQYLNRTCYTGITGHEFHFTVYEKGAFYGRHLDQFRNDQHRQYSMVIYLNPDWASGDGGELMVHEGDTAYTISPDSGKSVFFKSSELAHEVLVTHKPRMSITGWFKV
jgi:SM-20-related protein